MTKELDSVIMKKLCFLYKKIIVDNLLKILYNLTKYYRQEK